MSRKWCLDASPLMTLGKISQLSLLETLCSEIVIPEGVVQEIDQGPAEDGAKMWIHGPGSRFIRHVSDIRPVIAAWDLGRGATEVLSWAHLHPAFEAIIDDRTAKNCAFSLGVRARGTIGVILLAKKEGLVSEFEPWLHQLVQSGWEDR